jgi:integrase
MAPNPDTLSSLSPQDSVDFLLDPSEVAKGRAAAEKYLGTFRNEDSRRIAEEALETLATVISGGRCDGVDFPWQQVRPYHGAAALTILKERGAPATIEALRCRRDSTRTYRVVPEAYPARQVQKIGSTLNKVIEECCQLGFVSEEDREATATANRSTGSKPQKKRSPSQGRLLGDGEIRALVAACAAGENAQGSRDAVFFSLVYRGLRIAEITALTLESVRFSNKTGVCSILARPSRGGGRGRRVELTNDELICLEDWLVHRGDESGPLLCTLGRGGKIEGKRLTTAMLKQICEDRGAKAKVAPFVPNDLSRSAEALTEHRKTARRRAARRAQEIPNAAEQLLFDNGDSESDELAETIRFPFLGLSI